MNALLVDKKNRKELKKHVNAIHCANNLSLIQRKLFNALLYNAYSELPYKNIFQIRAKELYQLIGFNSRDTGLLKEALLGMITTAIEWNAIGYSNDGEKAWKASSILASAELSNGVCTYEYSQVMKDLLYKPDIYGKINIELLAKFKSGYGLALYENCVRYKGLPQTPWIPIDVFKKLMGVDEKKYAVFKDFKKRVIDIGVNEVNNLSAIYIVPEMERINQKVTKIRFKLRKPVDACEIMQSKPTMKEGMRDHLINIFGFSNAMISDVEEMYDVNYISEKIALIMQSDSFKSGNIRGLAGYLIGALKKDYKLPRSSKTVISEKKIADENREKEEQYKLDRQESNYKKYLTKKISDYINALTEEKKLILDSAFEDHIRLMDPILKGMYKKYKLEHPATKAQYNKFIQEHCRKSIGYILSMDEYFELMEI